MHPLIPHHPHRLHRQQRRKRLADLPIQPRGPDLLDENHIRFARDAQLLRGDFAEDADREAGPGEGVPPDEVGGDAELGAEGADFVFEEFAEGLDEFEVHVRGEAADVVVGFDGLGGAAEGDAFDDVGVQGALEEELDGAGGGRVVRFGGDAQRGFLEDGDEEVSDDLAFLLGLGDAGEGGEEARGGVYDGEVDAEVLGESPVDVVGFVVAQEAVVDEDGVEAGADGRVH